MNELFNLMNTPSDFQESVMSVYNDESTTGVLPIVRDIIGFSLTGHVNSAEELVSLGNAKRAKLGSALDIGLGGHKAINIQRFSLDSNGQLIMHYAPSEDNGKYPYPNDTYSVRNDNNGCVRTHIRSVPRYLASEALRKTSGDENASANLDPPRLCFVDMMATTLDKPDPKLGEGDEVLDNQVTKMAEKLGITPDQYYVINWSISCLQAVVFAKNNNMPQPVLIASLPVLERWFGRVGAVGTRSFRTGLIHASEAPHGEVLVSGRQLAYKVKTRESISSALVDFWSSIIDLPDGFVSNISSYYGRKRV